MPIVDASKTSAAAHFGTLGSREFEAGMIAAKPDELDGFARSKSPMERGVRNSRTHAGQPTRAERDDGGAGAENRQTLHPRGGEGIRAQGFASARKGAKRRVRQGARGEGVGVGCEKTSEKGGRRPIRQAPALPIGRPQA